MLTVKEKIDKFNNIINSETGVNVNKKLEHKILNSSVLEGNIFCDNDIINCCKFIDKEIGYFLNQNETFKGDPALFFDFLNFGFRVNIESSCLNIEIRGFERNEMSHISIKLKPINHVVRDLVFTPETENFILENNIEKYDLNFILFLAFYISIMKKKVNKDKMLDFKLKLF